VLLVASSTHTHFKEGKRKKQRKRKRQRQKETEGTKEWRVGERMSLERAQREVSVEREIED